MIRTKRKLPKKFNISGVRMLKLLGLLYQGDTQVKDVIKLFYDTPKQREANSVHVSLCKYLNTLKIIGIRVEKHKDKYEAYNLPYTYSFTAKELETIQKFKQCSDLILDGKSKESFDKFIKALENRYDDNTQTLVNTIDKTDLLDFSFYFKSMKEQLAECEKYISDNQILDILYALKGGDERRVSGRPLEINFGKRSAFLKLYNHKDSQIYEIALKNIRSIIQSPQKSGTQMAHTTSIVFKLHGRLAENYELKENEICKGTDNEGSLIIVNQNEDITILLHRLLRYGKNCTVCTPISVREQMKELIEQTIANYS